MKISNRLFYTLCFGGAALVLLLMAAWNLGWIGQERGARPEAAGSEAAADVTPPNGSAAEAVADETPPSPGWVKVGGIWRPGSDIEATSNGNNGSNNNHNPSETYVGTVEPGDRKPNTESESDSRVRFDAGRSPRIQRDASPQSESLAEALAANRAGSANRAASRSGQEAGGRSQAMAESGTGDRLTPLGKPEPFDRETFLADPVRYTRQHVPGRAFQAAESGPGVTPIRRLSRPYQRIIQGESVVLRVEAEPGMPVTFYSSHLGIFQESETSTVTVQADESGTATAHFTATAGTHGLTPIIAGSPVHSGQAQFTIDVVLPGITPGP